MTLQTIAKLAENVSAVLLSTVQREFNALPTRKAALGRIFAEKDANFPGLSQLTYRGEKPPAAFDAGGWTTITTKKVGQKAELKRFKPNELASVRHISASEAITYDGRGKRQYSRTIENFEARKAIRITNANASEIDYAKSYLIKTFEQLRFPNRVVDANIWFTEPGVRLNEWVEPLITETLTYAQFKQEVQVEKKRQRAAARSVAAVNPGVKAKDRVLFGVIGAARDTSTPYAARYHDMHLATPDQINALGKQVVISHKHLSHPFSLGAYSNNGYTTTVADQNNVLKFMRHYLPNAVVIGVPRTVSIESLTKRFPGHVLLSDALRPEIERVVDTKTSSDVLAAAAERVRMRASRAHKLAAYAALMEPQHFAALTSPDTRQYLRNLLLAAPEVTEPTMDEQLYNEFARRESDFDTEIAKQVLVWQNRADRYVMVAANGYYASKPTPEEIRHLVLYINAVDAELAGDAL